MTVHQSQSVGERTRVRCQNGWMGCTKVDHHVEGDSVSDGSERL